MAVDLQQLIRGDAAQPQEERHRALTEIVLQAPRGGQVDLLEDIAGVDPPLEPRIQAEGHHAAQPGLVPGQQHPPALAVPIGDAEQEAVRRARILGHGSVHRGIIAPPGLHKTDKRD
jgi:hypothetical protein